MERITVDDDGGFRLAGHGKMTDGREVVRRMRKPALAVEHHIEQLDEAAKVRA